MGCIRPVRKPLDPGLKIGEWYRDDGRRHKG